MQFRELLEGARFRIFGLELDDGSCPASEFLEQLDHDDPVAAKSMAALLSVHADKGPILNATKSRSIAGFPDLFEFKSRRGARVLYFFMTGGITVLVAGFKKGSPAGREYARAGRLMTRFKEVHRGRERRRTRRA